MAAKLTGLPDSAWRATSSVIRSEYRGRIESFMAVKRSSSLLCLSGVLSERHADACQSPLWAGSRGYRLSDADTQMFLLSFYSCPTNIVKYSFEQKSVLPYPMRGIPPASAAPLVESCPRAQLRVSIADAGQWLSVVTFLTTNRAHSSVQTVQ